MPPSACLSRPTMSTTRISVTDSGMRLTLVRIRSSSAKASARGRNDTSMGRSAAISALTSSATRWANPSGSGPNSKSILADSGSMFPPVTALPHSFQITPQRMCSAVWVRIKAWRRSQSSVPVTRAPTSGVSPETVCHTTSWPRTSVTAADPPSHSRVPVSWGCPPPVA